MGYTIDHHSNPRRNTMLVEAQVTINGSRAAIWAAITDIANASEIISGIENIEIVEKPANGLLGLKWRETPKLFCEPATVEKMNNHASEKQFYQNQREDPGGGVLNTNK